MYQDGIRAYQTKAAAHMIAEERLDPSYIVCVIRLCDRHLLRDEENHWKHINYYLEAAARSNASDADSTVPPENKAPPQVEDQHRIVEQASMICCLDNPHDIEELRQQFETKKSQEELRILPIVSTHRSEAP